MAAAARIAFHFFMSYLLFVSAASRVAVRPFVSHEDEGRPTLPSEEMTTTEVSLPSSTAAEGFQQVELTLRRPFDAHRPHHHHHHHEDDDALDDRHYHHHHPHHHHHEEDEFLEEPRHHRHRRNGEGFVIPYGNDMLIGENSMPRKMEKEVEAAERGAVEELKEWSPSSVDWEQAAEERRRHRKGKCEHKKKKPEEDSDSDDEDDDEAEDRKKELKWMRKKQMEERKDREEDGWMDWFSGFWNGF